MDRSTIFHGKLHFHFRLPPFQELFWHNQRVIDADHTTWPATDGPLEAGGLQTPRRVSSPEERAFVEGLRVGKTMSTTHLGIVCNIYKNGDDWGMVHFCFTPHDPTGHELWSWSKFEHPNWKEFNWWLLMLIVEFFLFTWDGWPPFENRV